MENYKQILDRGIDSETANALFLTPTLYTPPPPPPQASSTDVEDLLNYLEEETRRGKKNPYIKTILRLKLKNLLEEIEDINKRNKLFEVKRTNSALKNFAKVYTIEGKLGFDARSFLDSARENLIKILRDNRNTKVKLILECYMDFPSRNEIKPARFHSCIEVNLDGTNEEDIYDKMVDLILENIARFMAMGSDVRFHSIKLLELHTVSYKPLKGETYIPLPRRWPIKRL